MRRVYHHTQNAQSNANFTNCCQKSECAVGQQMYLCVVFSVTDGVALHHSGIGVVLHNTNQQLSDRSKIGTSAAAKQKSSQTGAMA